MSSLSVASIVLSFLLNGFLGRKESFGEVEVERERESMRDVLLGKSCKENVV
jgi:hypothetical protein